ncbi:hypothetical protein THAOC_09248 [Thalassiosira oceanica]|uniref:Uncharacterized protein n=1 Tax=Thalassiosira oceanica TaxID=159749 RepID=K0SSY9_THAOC|nr:hypothetical protein THAOC_09248 [Thalassiosira oceanica]|eukprot:EJK69488.1 hypothetical protein THAOC_09248 [Thalassiosira oceanica]
MGCASSKAATQEVDPVSGPKWFGRSHARPQARGSFPPWTFRVEDCKELQNVDSPGLGEPVTSPRSNRLPSLLQSNATMDVSHHRTFKDNTADVSGSVLPAEPKAVVSTSLGTRTSSAAAYAMATYLDFLVCGLSAVEPHTGSYILTRTAAWFSASTRTDDGLTPSTPPSIGKVEAALAFALYIRVVYSCAIGAISSSKCRRLGRSESPTKRVASRFSAGKNSKSPLLSRVYSRIIPSIFDRDKQDMTSRMIANAAVLQAGSTQSPLKYPKRGVCQPLASGLQVPCVYP